MKHMLTYIHYRLSVFYQKTFGIKESPGYLLVLSSYDWGLLVLLLSLLCYLLAIETIILSLYAVKMNVLFIVITSIPFAIVYIFSDKICKNGKDHFKVLETKYKHEKLKLIKGIFVWLFTLLSLPCFLVALNL